MGSINYVEKDGDTIGDSEGFTGESYTDINDLVIITGEECCLAEDDDLYDSEYDPTRTTPHAFYLESPERELNYWLRKLEGTQFSIRWAYQKICAGGLFTDARPGISHSIWLRSYWKYYMKEERKINKRINELVLRMVINTRC